MSHTLTIRVSDSTYQQLQRAAELFHQPTEAIIAQSLRHTLPPLLEEIPVEYQPDLYPLLHMTDQDLQYEVRQVFPSKRWAEYETLLEWKKTRPLSADEEQRLTALRREADLLTFRRSYAAVLLKRYGYRLPSVQELPQPA